MSRIPFESTNDALALSDLDIKPENARLSATTGSGAPSCSILRQQTLIQEAEGVPEAMSEAQFKCYSNEFYIPTGLHYTNSTSLCNRNQNLIPEVSDSLRQDHLQLLQAMRPPINKTLWPPALQSLLRQSWVESIQDRLSIKEASTLLRLVLLRQRRLPPNQQHQQQAAPKINMSQISHFQSEPMFPPPPPLWSPPLSQQDIPSPGSPKGVMENVFLTSNNKKATPATSVIAVHDEVLLEQQQQQQQQQQTPSSNSPPPFRSGSGRRNHEKKAFTFTGNIPSFLKLPNEGIFPAIDLASPMVSVQEMFKSDVIM